MTLAALILGALALGLGLYGLATRIRPVKLLGEPLRASMGKLKTLGDPWSSLGPNTKTYSVGTGGSTQTIPAYYKRQLIRLSLDTSLSTAVVYGLLNPGSAPGQNGTVSASNFHFALSTTQPPLELEYTGAIQLLANSGTILVGAVEG